MQVAPGHVGLNVTDLDRSVAFYGQVLGLEVLRRSDEPGRGFAFLGRDGRPMVTLWRQSAGRFAADRPGLHHLAFELDSLEEVRAAEARLRRLGATIHHGGIAAHAEGRDSGGLFFEDPDGARLELYVAAGLAGHAAPAGAAPTCGFF